MKIALDYDVTYSADPLFWDGFIVAAHASGRDVRVVTARDDRFDRTPLVALEKEVEVVYSRGTAKRWYVQHFVPDFQVQIWIDDKPESILQNSPTSPEDLAKWRAERGEGPSFPLGACGC